MSLKGALCLSLVDVSDSASSDNDENDDLKNLFFIINEHNRQS